MANRTTRLWRILDGSVQNRASRTFSIVMIALIFLSVTVAALGTVQRFAVAAGGLLAIIELVTVVIFTVEYVARLTLCTHGPAKGNPIVGRVRFALRPLMIVDFLAIAPFYLPFFGIGGTYLRVLRLARLMRVLKASRYMKSMQMLGRVVQKKAPELLTTLAVLIVLMIVASFVVYDAEHAAQPEKFTSVPATMWWAMATLTTVGYGDMTPITTLGRFLASAVAILGIGMVALPAGILAEGLLGEFRSRKSSETRVCPHCGKTVDFAFRSNNDG